jgi:YVTN family beta-propeller protein
MRTAIAGLLLLALAGCDEAEKRPDLAFISDERGDSVVAVDTSTGRIHSRIAAGKRPRGIALSRDGRTLYVALSGSAPAGPRVDESRLPPPDRSADGIAVIDVETGAVRRVLKAGADPETFALSPDGTTLYVANEDSAQMSAIDLRSGGMRGQTKVGEEPEGIAVSADGKRVFVACEASDRIDIVDAERMQRLASVAIAGRPRSLMASADGRFVYATIENAGQLAILSAADGRLLKLIDIAAGNRSIRPMGLAEGAGGRLFLTTGRGASVVEVDVERAAVVRRIESVGPRPWGIALTGDGKTLITADGPSGTISLIDSASGSIWARPKIGVSPWGVAAGH